MLVKLCWVGLVELLGRSTKRSIECVAPPVAPVKRPSVTSSNSPLSILCNKRPQFRRRLPASDSEIKRNQQKLNLRTVNPVALLNEHRKFVPGELGPKRQVALGHQVIVNDERHTAPGDSIISMSRGRVLRQNIR